MATITETEDQRAFEIFAGFYPHEAYETSPERFWQMFHAKHPNVSRERMVEILDETRGDEQTKERNDVSE